MGDAGGAGGNNMNIKQAKNEVKNTVKAYLSKDAHGEYVIPQIRQRPMLLIGPPGVGKTQIMEQIARECKIGLVAYTITHHTRQSAVGLPFIKEREYDGKSYSVTEYTMSEIIASVYERMEATGLKEGILFIDEINCVSETLAPTMLQFLQCKTFGNQAVPKGWVIVAAGNPPEYNKSVRDFDMVTLDRVRYISIEADYQVWKEYARDVHIHDALLSYLELHPNNFYRVETDVDGMNFVTARGWEDLSSLLKVYEAGELAVTEDVIGEFIHHPDIAEDVYAYLEIYRKYNEDYGVSDILSGNVKKSVYKRVFDADFDERITVVNLLLSGLTVVFSDVARERKMVQLWYEFLKEYRKSQRSPEEQHALYNSAVEQFSKNMEILKESSLILPKEYYIRQDVLRHIKGDFDTVMDDFTEESEKLSTMEDAAGEKQLSMIYIFSAFYAEAKNIIDHYGLKKEKSPETVRFDVFANESIRLVITGVGEINAVAAVSNIGGAYGISPDDEILNVGCGAGFSSDICLGSIFLGNKLTEQMTGRTFYPDMLMKANFRECEIVTVARVLNEGGDSVVYDMEAAAVYQAAAFFVGPHHMHFIKLVSDAGERIDQSKITELFALQEDKICGYIDRLLSVGGNKTSIDDKIKGDNMADSNATDDTKSAWNIDRLTSDMRCSKVMGDQLAQLIKYCRLSGIDYKAVLDEYYTNGLLPCESKREGKKCLFELKQRLL